MNSQIDNLITALNNMGSAFCDYTWSMFVQASVLIVALLLVDLLIRKRVRATFRYWMWMLVFVKLVLPPTLSVPTGIGYWLGDYVVRDSVATRQPADVTQLESARQPAPSQIAAIPDEPITPPVSASPIVTVPTDSTVIPSVNTLTGQGIVFGLWMIGVLAITALLVQRIFFVQGLIRQSELAEDRLAEVLNQCRQRLELQRRIELKLSHNVTSPAVCGLSHPAILIPKQILEQLSQEKLRAVLIHELAHVKRGDLWINCVQTFLQIVYFYNPFVWLANVLVRRIREQAVDEMVLVALGAEARSYSNALIDIAEMAFTRPALSLRLVGVVESKKALSRRIKHILHRPFPKSAKLGFLGLLTIIITAAVLLPMAKAQKQANVAETESMPKQFLATLPNGATVELVGLFTGPSIEEFTWWRPDGSSIPQQEYNFYKSKISPRHIRHTDPWEFEYGYVLRVTPSDASVMVAVSVGTQGACGHPDKDGISVSFVESDKRQREKGLPQLGDIKVMAACGHFTPESWNRGSSFSDKGVGLYPQSFLLDDGSTIMLSGVRPDRFKPDTGLMVDAVVNADDVEMNVLYETKDAKVHRISPQSFGGGPSLKSSVERRKPMMQYTFRLQAVKQEDLKRIAVRHRRYKTVTFRNVALKLKVKTGVQVEVERPDVLREPSERYPMIPSAINTAKDGISTSYEKGEFAATLDDGETLELMGVCEHPNEGKHWWRPDGKLLDEAPDTRKARYDKSAYFDKTTERKIEIVYRCSWPESESRTVLFGKITFRVLSHDYLGRLAEDKGYYSMILAIPQKLRVKTSDIVLGMQKLGHTRRQWATFKNVSLHPGQKTDVEVEVKAEPKVPEEMIGTWFFDNPSGDEEQMAVFPDSRVVVSYSNGHKDQTSYVNGFIELAEYGNARCRMAVQEDGTLVQRFGPSDSAGNRWKRIAVEPHINLLRPLTGASSEYGEKFSATLPNGATVELLGVCEHPSEGKQWWRPDGTILSQAPYHTTGSQSTDEKQGYVYYEFAIKLSDPDRMSYFWMIPGSGHGSDTGSPRDENGHPIPALKAYAANLPQEQKTTTVRIGATAAQWQTVVAYKPDDREETYSEGEYAIAFGTPYVKGNRTFVPIVHNYNRKEKQYAIQVIAITKSGQVRKSGYSGSGGNTLSSLTYIFNELPLETIKEFQFQVRPYTWIEFKNVSLRPGLKTGVQVISYREDSRLPVSGRTERKVLGIGPGWRELRRVVGDNYGGSIGGYSSDPNKCSEYFHKVLSRTQPGDTFVILFAFDEEKWGHTQMVPEQYRDLLPIPWAQIKSRVDRGELVEIKGKARGLDTIVLAAPEWERLTTLIRQTELLRAFKKINEEP